MSVDLVSISTPIRLQNNLTFTLHNVTKIALSTFHPYITYKL